MKLFLDTANTDEIKRYADMNLCDGVTTNPTLVARENAPADEIYLRIAEIVDGPISVETISIDADGIIEEGRRFADMHKNFVIKIPTTLEGLKAVNKLSSEGIKTNCTLCFSANQAMLVAKAGATYVSPFVGRLDDGGHDGMELIADIIRIYGNYDYQTEVIVASIRHALHVLDSARIGAHIVTIPPGVVDKLIKHPLTDIGIAQFLDDYDKIPK